MEIMPVKRITEVEEAIRCMQHMCKDHTYRVRTHKERKGHRG